MPKNPAAIDLKWSKLSCAEFWAARLPGGVVLMHETVSLDYGGRESMVFVPMDDDTFDAWIKANKNKEAS